MSVPLASTSEPTIERAGLDSNLGGHTLRIGAGTSALLDTVRAGAAILVSVNHASAILLNKELHLGGFAVCTFFLLSGFLITFSLISRGYSGGIKIHEFMSDRVARIFTPYIPALIAIAIVEYFFINERWGLPGQSSGIYAFIGNALMLQNYPIFQAATYVHNVDAFYVRPYNSAEPFWTVAIEFWIYIFVGLVVVVSTGGMKVVRPSVAIFLCISVPVVTWNSFAGGGGALSLTWALGALGALLFWRAGKLSSRAQKMLGCALLAYGVTCWPARAYFVQMSAYDIPLNTFMGSILLGLAIILHNVRPKEWIIRATELLAAYSYTLYLTHNTVIVMFKEHGNVDSIASLVVVLIVTQVVAVAFYYLFERHYKVVGRTLRPVFAKLVYRPVNRIDPRSV